jgi:hypothetical protein
VKAIGEVSVSISLSSDRWHIDLTPLEKLSLTKIRKEMTETYQEDSGTDGGILHFCGTKRNYAELGTVSCPLEIDDDDDSDVCISFCLPAIPEDYEGDKETNPSYSVATTQNSYGSLRILHNAYSSSQNKQCDAD